LGIVAIVDELARAAAACLRQALAWRADEDRSNHWFTLADCCRHAEIDAAFIAPWRLAVRVRNLAGAAAELDDWEGVSVPASTATDILGELADSLAEDAERAS
jgi:hypothetical protein